MYTREVLENENELWNKFVSSSPNGDLLQSFEWGELKRKSSGWKPIRIAVFDSDKIVGAISVLKRSLPYVKKSIYYAPRGPVCDFSNHSILSTLMNAVKERGIKDKAIFLKIDPAIKSDSIEVISAIEASGFHRLVEKNGFGGVQPRCVMQLDLTPSLEDILNGCKPKWRYNIRLAEKKGVIVNSECKKDDLKLFYNVLVETSKRDGFIIRNFNYYENMWDYLVEPGYAKLFLTEYEGEIIAGAILFIFGDKCWYTYGASSNNHRNVMPNHLMQWKMITWAKESGCSCYDFRGVSQSSTANENDHLQGLNRFKEGFGAKFIEYIGEFDMPYSKTWHMIWTKVKPTATSVIKSIKNPTNYTGSLRDDT